MPSVSGKIIKEEHIFMNLITYTTSTVWPNTVFHNCYTDNFILILKWPWSTKWTMESWFSCVFFTICMSDHTISSFVIIQSQINKVLKYCRYAYIITHSIAWGQPSLKYMGNPINKQVDIHFIIIFLVVLFCWGHFGLL